MKEEDPPKPVCDACFLLVHGEEYEGYDAVLCEEHRTKSCRVLLADPYVEDQF